MYCVKCNSEKSEMKTKTKCMDCHRKEHAEYMRKFSSKPENKEKKQISDKNYYNKNKTEIREKCNSEYHNDPVKKQKKRESDKKYNEKVKTDPEKLEKKRESSRKSNKKRRSTTEGLQKSRESCRNYGKTHRDGINKRRRERRKTNENERIADNLRRAIKRVISATGIQKTWKGEITQELTQAIINKIGTRPDESFHLDHIIPISKFNLTIKEHRILANSPENLRWLPGSENLEKKDVVDFQLIKQSEDLIHIAKIIGLL